MTNISDWMQRKKNSHPPFCSNRIKLSGSNIAVHPVKSLSYDIRGYVTNEVHDNLNSPTLSPRAGQDRALNNFTLKK